MTARAETILETVKTLVTGLPTTGDDIVRGQVYPEDKDSFLAVNMGEEQPVGEPDMSTQDEYLDVEITAGVRDNSGVDTALNSIYAEVYAAIFADHQLGLGTYVLTTIWMGRSAPQRTDALQKKTAIQTMLFRVHYRHSYTSAEA